MKKIIVVFLFFSVIVCGAQVFQNNEHYSETQVSERWNKSDIAIEETSIDYIDTFPGAIEAHSPFLLNNELEGTMEKTGSFKLKEKEKKEKRFSFMLFGFVSIALMIISNIFFFRGKKRLVSFFSFIAAFITIFSFFTFMITFLVASFFVVLAAIAASVVFAAALEGDYKRYGIFVIIYYILIITHLIFLFMGL
jgi:hypothetical protein